MYVVVTTKKELDRVTALMERAAQSAPSVFVLENTKGKREGWRVQHNGLGYSWLERELPEYC